MRKILTSAVSLIAIGSAVMYGSLAFFSDTEASVDNTFTAGQIDLKIDNTEFYNGLVCAEVDGEPEVYEWELAEGVELADLDEYTESLLETTCTGTWALTDLTNERFFNYDDIKPEDEGMASISMHVINNDAWACMNVETTENTALDPSGLMSDGLSFFAWMDTDEDGEFDESEEVLFGPESATTAMNTSIALADSTTGDGPLVGSDNEADASYIGVKWCAGSFDVDLNCDGTTMTNEYQGGTFAADLTFDVVQSRNNEDFVCETDEPGVGGVGAVLGAYTAPTGDDCDVLVEDGQSIQAAIDDAGTEAGETVCVAPGTYTGNVNVNKAITLAGDGADATSTINGLVDITADGATFQGFKVLPGTTVPNQEAGIAVLASNVTVDSNFIYDMASVAGGSIKGIYVYNADENNHLMNTTITNNRVELMRNSAKGTYGIMVQGVVDGVNIMNNTVYDLDTQGWGASGVEITPTGSDVFAPKNIVITKNHIEKTRGTSEQGKAVTIDWASPTNRSDASEITLTYNNFVDTPVDVRNLDDVNTLFAPNNWWGDLTPVVEGDVDTTPEALAQFAN